MEKTLCWWTTHALENKTGIEDLERLPFLYEESQDEWIGTSTFVEKEASQRKDAKLFT